MAGELATEDAALLRQGLLHEHMSDPAADRDAPRGPDVLLDGLSGAEVVDHGCALALGQEVLGQERGQMVASDDVPLLVHDNAAVGIAVEADSQGGLLP